MTHYALTTSDLLAPAAPSRAAVRGQELARRIVVPSVFGDAIVALGALVSAFFLRFHTPLRHLGFYTLEMPWADYAGHIIFETALLVLIFHHLGLYNAQTPLRWRKVVPTIAAGCALWCVGNAALTSLLNFNTLVSRLYLLTGCATAAGALLLWRGLLDAVLRAAPVADRLRRRILCVGWSDEAAQLARHIAADERHPYAIVGAVPATDGGDYALGLSNGVRHLGETGQLRPLLARHGVDMVVVCDPDPSRDALLALASLCEKEMVDFKVIPSGFQILLSGLHLETVSGVPVLGISRLPLDSAFAEFAKRAVDIVGAFVGLVLGAPLIAVFGALVYLESPGPIFYRQRRNGGNGRSFFILKIRSMKLDAEGGARPGWTQKDDPRRLRVGAFMRRWNVDEIPQFLNVLRGEMSLVGPRPERPEFIVNFKEEIPHYNARHGIRPGITGWAQVNGLRGDTDLGERVRCDLFYIENWSLLLDLQIMFMTFFKRQNAG